MKRPLAPPATDDFVHEVALPPGMPPTEAEACITLPLPDSFSAMQFAFELDMFQKKALAAVERGDSVLVAAHTSAGKTVVAQYAVALSVARKQRVVYTSPIKALSNQKYRELSQQFGGDVGLMTGDVNVNPDAAVLVMTTEILRNMLYRGHELIREVQWVVFDEVHYMRDRERGVIWEECIILLPSAARFVFLSATIPNALEFARWVAATHSAPCHVVSTSKRPTPLEHWVYPAGADGLLLLKGADGAFNGANFDAAMQQLRTPAGTAAAAKTGSRDSPALRTLVEWLQRRQLTPAVVFSFSRRACEGAAMHARGLNPLSEPRQAAIRTVFDAAVATLAQADQQVEQIERMLPLLLRGVAVHHSGLLPVLKEVVEILFQEGLILFLFATETFALGLNMPARAVVFTSLRKWDGEVFRPPSAAEYIQMSGRAGRRGLDPKGTVILLLSEELEQQTVESMMAGSALPLQSAFRLRYNTLLKLCTLESYEPEQLIRQSFYTFQRQQQVPELERRRASIQIQARRLTQPAEFTLRRLLQLKARMAAQAEELAHFTRKLRYSMRFLQPGRIVHVCKGDKAAAGESGWGVLLGWGCEQPASASGPPKADRMTYGARLSAMVDISEDNIVLDVLLPCAPDAADLCAEGLPPRFVSVTDEQAEPYVLALRLSCLNQLSAVRLWLPDDISTRSGRRLVCHALRQAFSSHRLGDQEIARQLTLHPVDHLGVTDPQCLALANELAGLEASYKGLQDSWALEVGGALASQVGQQDEEAAALPAPTTLADLELALDRLKRKLDLEEEDRKIVQQAQAVACDEFAITARKMHRVLVKLGHVSEDRVVQLKGRAAAEVESCDEILVAELILSGFFNELTPAAAASICSCLIAADLETVKNPPVPHPDLQGPLHSLQEAAVQVARVYTEAGIPTDEDEFKKRFDGGMINMVYSWCEGVSFAELCKSCDLFEGSIIRALRRLSELLDELKSAAKAIGNDELFDKLEQSCVLIRRDIVFASSLYIEI